MELIQKLVEFRKNAGLNQEQIATFLGVERSTYAKMETGERKMTTLQVDRVLNLYGLEYDDIEEKNVTSPLCIAFRANSISNEGMKSIADANRIIINSCDMDFLLKKNDDIVKPCFQVQNSIKKLSPKVLAANCRKFLGAESEGYIDIFRLAAQIEKLSILKMPIADQISGMCLKKEKTYCIVINTSMSAGRQRFTLAHELYHLFYDNIDYAVICKMSPEANEENEKRADEFASYLLAPDSSLGNDCIQFSGTQIPLEYVIQLEQKYGMSHQSMLVRLYKDNFVSHKKAEEYKSVSITSEAKKLGYEAFLYQPESKFCRQTLGYYIKQVQELYNKELISDGRYEQFLLEAYRDDLFLNVQEDICCND